jgi:hypothetical protein
MVGHYQSLSRHNQLIAWQQQFSFKPAKEITRVNLEALQGSFIKQVSVK